MSGACPIDLVVLVGLPGSGKSFLAAQIESLGGWRVVRPDDRGDALEQFFAALQGVQGDGDATQDPGRRRGHRKGIRIIVDACNHTTAIRRALIEEVRRLSVRRGDAGGNDDASDSVVARAVCLSIDADLCRRRTTTRFRDGSANQIKALARFDAAQDAFEEVQSSEGWQHVYSAGTSEEADALARAIHRGPGSAPRTNRSAARNRPQIPPAPVAAPTPGPGPSKAEASPPARRHHHKPQAQNPQKGMKIDTHSSTLLLFDLNGTLVSKTRNRKRGGRIDCRPGVASLLRLVQRGFALGIYTSSTPPTVARAMEALERATNGALAGAFAHVLSRDDCVLAPQRAGQFEGGKEGQPWDTVKVRVH